jgi:hypothetical protein
MWKFLVLFSGNDEYCGFKYLNSTLFEIGEVLYGDCYANRNYFCNNEKGTSYIWYIRLHHYSDYDHFAKMLDTKLIWNIKTKKIQVNVIQLILIVISRKHNEIFFLCKIFA